MFINRMLLQFLKGNDRKLCVVVGLELILTLLSTGIALCSALIVRMITGTQKLGVFHSVYEVFAVIMVLMWARYIISKEKSVKAAKTGLSIKDSLRKKLLNQIFSLGPAYLGKERTGDITTTVSSRVDWLNNYYTIYLPNVVAAILNAVVLLTVLACFDVILATICLVAIIGLLLCPMLFYHLMKERGDKEWEAETVYYSECLDGIQGIATLKAFNANARYRNQIHQQGELLRYSVMKQLKVTMLENGILEFFARLGSAVSVAAVAVRFAQGKVEEEFLIYALFLTGACFAPMLNLISAWHVGYRGVTASSGIAKLLHKETEQSYRIWDTNLVQQEIKEVDPISYTSGDIRFHNICFCYPGEGEVLHNISFYLPRNTTMALVGTSGSGKSTIAHLLAGFYAPVAGEILIGEQMLTEDSVQKVQNCISAVWQDSHVFCGTVYENISMGRTKATKDEVIKAAKAANVDTFIQTLPNGYDTILGEGGFCFSGGERQRIAIARAFLKDAPIVILDEATSALDRKNEMEIQESLKRLSMGKTVLIIAHRMETIRSANQICILEHGRIVDSGTHELLMDTSKPYQKLMGFQKGRGFEHGR